MYAAPRDGHPAVFPPIVRKPPGTTLERRKFLRVGIK